MRCLFLPVIFSKLKKTYSYPKLTKSRLTDEDVKNSKWISNAGNDLPVIVHNANVMANCFKVELAVI